SRQFLSRAAELGFWLKMSAGEHIRPESLMTAISADAVSIENLSRLDAASASALAASATIVTLLPGSVFHGKQGIWPLARDMIDRGVAVALGTGFDPQTSPTLNMQMILSLACREMEMTPAEAISAATVNSACAIRREDAVGSLEFGKWADILILSVPDYREIPYHFGVNQVETVFKRGRIVYQRSDVVCPSNGVRDCPGKSSNASRIFLKAAIQGFRKISAMQSWPAGPFCCVRRWMPTTIERFSLSPEVRRPSSNRRFAPLQPPWQASI